MASFNISHPFYPRDVPVPHYVPNTYPTHLLVPPPLGVFALIFLAVWRLSRTDRFGRPLGGWEKAALSWWGLCGCIHMIIEGFISLNSRTFAGRNDIFSQMWKEYAMGDSRYAHGDACITIMEGLTAWLEGPGCFIIVWSFLNRHPMRHVLQFGVSIGQFYGTLLYFFTEIFDDFAHGPRFHPYYWWFLVFGLNSPWLVVPPILIYQSWKELTKAQKGLDNATGYNTSNGKEKIR
ncbi:3-beta-hydroxysteroid-Delta(8),Delta(7)-isomerase-like [Acanthaster planci]|uniref:3-beta-hydroxysteroid-Delta(8), Delta(7)-isomerase-like n=1 Tax=Acanthaster planci TaxID=133434 RepID=A0A8B7XJY9_ACAPL|nr:3-beta-hydroxysteroid-Delta(8),Delta(7)-isomerase-like [Acanthaster planci]